jgi:hypothetical protein
VEEEIETMQALRGRLLRLLGDWEALEAGDDCPCYCPRIECSA